MLLMGEFKNRKLIKEYFYGSLLEHILCMLGWATIWWFGFGLIFFGILLLVKVFKRLNGQNKTCEKAYDACILEDIEFIKKRAVDTLGVVEEELSLIDPIVAHGFANVDCIRVGKRLEAKRTIFSKLWPMIRSIFSNEVISDAVYIEGTDRNVRPSLVSVIMISFTEQQIMAYVCNYDIGLGIILEEYVREIFYRDVDSVNYGEETLHVWSETDQKWSRTIVQRLLLEVPSSKGIAASIVGETEMLDNQVMAAKALIRSKKEEIG